MDSTEKDETVKKILGLPAVLTLAQEEEIKLYDCDKLWLESGKFSKMIISRSYLSKKEEKILMPYRDYDE